MAGSARSRKRTSHGVLGRGGTRQHGTPPTGGPKVAGSNPASPTSEAQVNALRVGTSNTAGGPPANIWLTRGCAFDVAATPAPSATVLEPFVTTRPPWYGAPGRRRDVVAWHGFEGRTGGHRRHSRPFLQARTKTSAEEPCETLSKPAKRGSEGSARRAVAPEVPYPKPGGPRLGDLHARRTGPSSGRGRTGPESRRGRSRAQRVTSRPRAAR